MRRHPEHMHPAGGDLDHQQHLQPLEQHRVHGDQIHLWVPESRSDALSCKFVEKPPGCAMIAE
jgi:hypothetical protein